MGQKTYKKAEIRILLFSKIDVILSSGDSVVDVFDWFDDGQEFLVGDDWRTGNG